MAKVKEPIATKIPRRFSYGQVAGYVRVSTFEQDETPARGIRVQFVKENLTLTGADSPMSNLLLSVMGHLRSSRGRTSVNVSEGIELAKKAGVYLGRKKTLSLQRATELRRRLAKGEGKAALAREFDIDRTTVYRNAKRKKVICQNEEVNPGGDGTEP